MKPVDWDRISMFVALQQLRTPLSFLEFAQRWPALVSESLTDGVARLTERLEEFRRTGTPIPYDGKPDHLTGTLRVVSQAGPRDEEAAFRVEIASIRSVWMAEVRRLLRDNAHIIKRVRWQPMVPFGAAEWLMTDHPVLNMIFQDVERYEFRAGWGQKLANFFLPVSPRLALFAEVGVRSAGKFGATTEQTELLLKFQVERAFRSVYAHGDAPWVERLRPRTVDRDLANHEREMLTQWHPEQAEMEAEFEAELNAATLPSSRPDPAELKLPNVAGERARD